MIYQQSSLSVVVFIIIIAFNQLHEENYLRLMLIANVTPHSLVGINFSCVHTNNTYNFLPHLASLTCSTSLVSLTVHRLTRDLTRLIPITSRAYQPEPLSLSSKSLYHALPPFLETPLRTTDRCKWKNLME